MAYVVFATPSLSHQVSVEYLRSALETNALLSEHGHTQAWTQLAGDCFVAKARSKMVKEFLDGEGTDLFFLDDDLGWPADKALEFVESEVPVLAGVYPKKQDAADWPVSLQASEETGLLKEENGLYKSMLAPTGFLRIKRHILERLYPQCPTFRDILPDGTKIKVNAIFNSGPGADGNWWGEDFAFCNLCLANEIDIWIDPDILFYHRGTKLYSATMKDAIPTFRRRAREAQRKAMRTQSQAA